MAFDEHDGYCPAGKIICRNYNGINNKCYVFQKKHYDLDDFEVCPFPSRQSEIED